jgi:hypothetical protein
MSRKGGVELSMSTIIVLILILIVLVMMILIATGALGNFGNSIMNSLKSALNIFNSSTSVK